MGSQVCVTGANGFIGSWLVKLLLEGGYHVRGTVRDPGNKQRIGHLEGLKGARDRLTLVKGDLMDHESMFAAIDGCSGVFHVACPVLSQTSTANPEVDILDPAIKGTLHVLEACTKAKVERVIMTSSVGAMTADPNRPKEVVVDETCWSNEDYLMKNQYWYMLGKTLGEKAAWDYARRNELNLITICPTMVLGVLLQPTVNSSSHQVLMLLNGSSDSYENLTCGVVDVKDVARAHVLAYETAAASGRYFCCCEMVTKSTIIEIIKRIYPNCTVPSRCIEVQRLQTLPKEFSTKRLQSLGFTYTPLEATLKDTVESLKGKGFLN